MLDGIEKVLEVVPAHAGVIPVAYLTQELFGNEQAIQELCSQDRSVAQKVFEWIDDLFVRIGGNQEEKRLVKEKQSITKVRELFEKALDHANINLQSKPAYYIGKTTDGIDIAIADGEVDPSLYAKAKDLHKYLKKYVPSHFVINSDGKNISILNNRELREYSGSKYTNRIRSRDQDIYNSKVRIASNLGDVIEVSKNGRWEPSRHSSHLGSPNIAKYGFIRYDTEFAIPTDRGSFETFDADMLVELNGDGTARFYDLVNIKKSGRKIAFSGRHPTTFNHIISDSEDDVNNDEHFSRNLDVSDEYRPDGTRKDLQAVHNLNQRKLSGVLDLGGLPAPSIAVTKDSVVLAHAGVILKPSAILEYGVILVIIILKNSNK